MRGFFLFLVILCGAATSAFVWKKSFLALPAPVATATASNEKITVSWNAIFGATGYKIYRYTAGGAGHLLYQTVGGTTYEDLDVVNGRSQSYYITAFNDTEGGYPSNYAVATTNIDPPTLNTAPAKASVDLSWSPVSGAASYTVFRWNATYWQSIASNVSGTSYNDSVRPNGYTYVYRIKGVNGAGPGIESNESPCDVYLDPPSPVTASINSSNVVTLNWGSVAWADGYQIYRATASGGYMNYLGSTTSTTYGGGTVPGGTTYYYVVYAYNAGGQSPRSMEVASTGKPYSGAKPPHEGACPFDPPTNCTTDPVDGGLPKTCGDGAGTLFGDPVNLANGTEVYAPALDLEAYNPNGPSPVFQRNFRSNQARVGYFSPGLSVGWLHNYDVRIIPSASTSAWEPLSMVYPNGAVETLTPTLSSGTPTGAFSYTNGLPYFVTGIASGTTNQWTSIELTWRDQTKWKLELHSTGSYVLTRITNRMGKSIDIAYDVQRRLSTITDTTSSTVLLSFTYGSNGIISKVEDAYSRKVAFGTTFNSGRYLLSSRSVIAAASNPSPATRASYGYSLIDQRPHITSITVPSPTGTGTQTGNIYYNGSTGQVTSLVDSNGNKREYTYGSGNTTVTLKNSSNVTQVYWNQNYNAGNRNSGRTDSAGKTDVIEYLDANNPAKPTRIENANGRESFFTYDSKGNPLTETDPRGVVTTYTWDYTNFHFGRLTSIQTSGKPATTITYFEPSGLVDTVTSPEPGGGVGTVNTSFTYDSLGNVLTVTTPGNNAVLSKTTTFSYTTDGGYSQSAKLGQPIRITDNLGHTSHLRYDSQGRVIESWDSLGNTTENTYDIAGAPLTVIAPATGQTGVGNSYTEYAYLYSGGPVTTVKAYDESGSLVRQTTTTYGKEGEVLGVSGSTEPATYTYDGAYRLKTLADGLNQVTTYTYNARGFLSKVAYPGGDETEYTDYDDAGNLLERLDGNGVVTNYVYNDDEDLLTDIEYPATPSLDVSFTYDGYGRRSSMTDPTGVTSYVYGELDELLSKTTTFTGLSGKTISYGYYPDGSRSSMTTPAGTYSYDYDDAGRPVSITNPFSETSSWTYLDNDWLWTQTLGNGAVTTYTYNALGQILNLENRTSANVLLSQFGSATYDGVGNMKSITANIPAVGSYSGLTTWNYDSKDQLTQEQSARMSGYTNTFAYDSAGNPTTFKGFSRTYNSQNQLTGVGFAYDGNGNPITYKGDSLTFDPENRMTAYGSVLTAGYNGDGHRAWKENSIARIYFLYDGPLIVSELDEVGNITTVNTWGAHGLLSTSDSLSSIFFTFDQRGATTQRLDGLQNIVTSNSFDAFGVAASVPNDPWDGLGAQYGYYLDSETDLQILTSRFYDKNTGRFLTKDPIGYMGGLNLYSYVGNSPVAYVDPSGLVKIEIRFRQVVIGGFMHAFIVITDNVKGSKTYGKQWALTGGPTNHGLVNNGYVKSYSGEFKKGAYDWGHAVAQSITIIDDQSEAQPVVDNGMSIASHLSRMPYKCKEYDDKHLYKPGHAHTFKYNPVTGPNSNSFAREVLERLGLLSRLNDILKVNKNSPFGRGKGLPTVTGWAADPWSH